MFYRTGITIAKKQDVVESHDCLHLEGICHIEEGRCKTCLLYFLLFSLSTELYNSLSVFLSLPPHTHARTHRQIQAYEDNFIYINSVIHTYSSFSTSIFFLFQIFNFLAFISWHFRQLKAECVVSGNTEQYENWCEISRPCFLYCQERCFKCQITAARKLMAANELRRYKPFPFGNKQF